MKVISKKISNKLPNNNELENKVTATKHSARILVIRKWPSENVYLYFEYRLYTVLPRKVLSLWKMVINLYHAYSQTIFETGSGHNKKNKAILKPK